MLIVGTAVSLLAAAGPVWAVRSGVALAVLAAIVASVLAGREINLARRAHAKALLAAAKTHGEALRAERARNAGVLDTLTQRARNAAAQIETQEVVIGELKVEIATLRGDKAHLSSQLRQREMLISSLRGTVQTQEAELLTLLRQDSGPNAVADRGGNAQVHILPRRVMADDERSAAATDARAVEPWFEEQQPTVVELVTADLPVVLPNYEGDRRRA